MFPRKERAAAVACLLVAVAANASAQRVKATGKGQVSVHAEGAPLGDLLRELAGLGPVRQLLIDEDVEGALVTLELESTPFSEAMIEVLQAARVNYVLRGGNGRPYHVYAGRGGSARVSAPGTARTPADYPAYKEPEPEGDDYEDEPYDENPFPEVSGDARLIAAPGMETVACAGTFLLCGLLLGSFAVGRRSRPGPPSS